MPQSPENQISTDVFAIPLEGNYLIYAPLRRVAFLGSGSAVNFIHRLQGQSIFLADLTAEEQDFLHFFQKVGLTGLEGDAPILTGRVGSFQPVDLTLFLTNSCNLRCVYCYAEGGELPRAAMDIRTARRGIDYVLGNAARLGRSRVRLSYHGGGEPTVNWATLTRSLVYARRQADPLGIEIQATLSSNGVFSAEKCQWIVTHMQAATISIDGCPEVQDVQRPYPSGRGSHPAVMQTLQRFDQAGLPYSLRMTGLPQSVGRLAESVDYLSAHAHPRQIVIEPVYSLGRGKQAGFAVEPEAFVQAFREAKSTGRAHGVEVQYSAARMDVITEYFCQSCGYGFNLTPHGNVSACYEVCSEDDRVAEQFIFGRYDSAQGRYVLDADKLAWLQGRNVDAQPWCKNCFCRWHCAGDCPHKTFSESQDGEFAGHARCLITRELTQDQILEKIIEAGGVVWSPAKYEHPDLKLQRATSGQ